MKLGFIGTGKITSSVVAGICGSQISFKKIILSNDKFDLQIPVTTDEVILPVPIKPNFIIVFSTLNY